LIRNIENIEKKDNKEVIIPVSEENNVNNCDEEESKTNDKNETLDKDENYVEHLQRLQAEFNNYRKRIEREKANFYKIAKRDLIYNLISVLDDMERFRQHFNSENQNDLEGFNLIYQKIVKIFKEEGLEEISAVGERFDPEFHEAIGIEETEIEQDELIIEEWQKGYIFGNQVLRPSKVKVGKYIKSN
jgi:molecular chaperone GrpE